MENEIIERLVNELYRAHERLAECQDAANQMADKLDEELDWLPQDWHDYEEEVEIDFSDRIFDLLPEYQITSDNDKWFILKKL